MSNDEDSSREWEPQDLCALNYSKFISEQIYTISLFTELRCCMWQHKKSFHERPYLYMLGFLF